MGLIARSVRHEELGNFLMSRRKRLNPESCGLPSMRSRRRTPGLRREDVSSIAGISTAYYTWIEQGRPFEISADVLYAIAGALRLSDVETSHIFALAGKTELRGKLWALSPWSSEVLEVVGHFEGGPALALTSWLDVLDANAAAQDLFEFERRTNLARWFFCRENPNVEPQNCEAIGSALVALLRRNRARGGDAHRFAEVVDGLRADSHDFALLWDGHIVDAPPLVEVEFEHWRRGRITFRTIVLCDPVASNQFALFMTPAPCRAEDPAPYGDSRNSASITSLPPRAPFPPPPAEAPAPAPAV
jgi:transcriptional regulator with XRE-family HTH domain